MRSVLIAGETAGMKDRLKASLSGRHTSRQESLLVGMTVIVQASQQAGKEASQQG